MSAWAQDHGLVPEGAAGSRTELSPLSFLARSAEVFGDHPAVAYDSTIWTYRQLHDQVERLTQALLSAGVRPGERVACLLPNIPTMLVSHFAVPLAGAVLVAINTRLSSEEVRYVLDHSGARLLIADSELLAGVLDAVDAVDHLANVLRVVDHTAPGPDVELATPMLDYEEFVAEPASLPAGLWTCPDESGPISINYTSGTTGRPKGVVYTHRGTYLNSLGEIHHSGHRAGGRYLWTLPMFHCNGWCTPWAVTAVGGLHVCLREVRDETIWSLIHEHEVTHFNGAPTVLSTIVNSPAATPLSRPVVATIAGAPPSPTLIEQAEQLGLSIVHVYGLTESYGPYSVCEHQPAWADEEPAVRMALRARQGVGMVQTDPLRVVDDSMQDVPRDGSTMGEIVMRGNNVMAGYFRDPEATVTAFRGGWFHTGDLGVVHPDSYVELRDRAKDVVISGGENISTVEVEQALSSHPAVLEVAVVGVPDEDWGERPKAFVVLRDGSDARPQDLIEHVKAKIARYKAPREVDILVELPKTSTGKIQKFVLREQEWAGHTTRING